LEIGKINKRRGRANKHTDVTQEASFWRFPCASLLNMERKPQGSREQKKLLQSL
jgi:hypothetical protein